MRRVLTRPLPQAALVASKTDKASMGKALKKQEALLRDMVALTLRPDLTRNQRTSLETCITVHMHQKETTGAPPPRPWPLRWPAWVLLRACCCVESAAQGLAPCSAATSAAAPLA